MIENLTSLQDSFYMFPLDMALEQYQYHSREYYAIKENTAKYISLNPTAMTITATVVAKS